LDFNQKNKAQTLSKSQTPLHTNRKLTLFPTIFSLSRGF
jgi:hypothetical protein